jgi:hypothetical protein
MDRTILEGSASAQATGGADATDRAAPTVNAGATFHLPTADQWYKAAYYKGGSTNAGYWDYASGNISDFIGSLRRLRPWHIDLLLPGHGATSTEALRCIDIGIARLETLLRETREVFSAMTGADHGYASIIRSLQGLNAASRPDADAG